MHPRRKAGVTGIGDAETSPMRRAEWRKTLDFHTRQNDLASVLRRSVETAAKSGRRANAVAGAWIIRWERCAPPPLQLGRRKTRATRAVKSAAAARSDDDAAF